MTRVITIDGPSGSGKGTIAQRVAQRLGWRMLDSGAIYRVLGLLVERAGVTPDEVERLRELAANMPLSFADGRVLLGEEDVSAAIRTEAAGNAASKVASVPEVRAALLEWQRNYAQPPDRTSKCRGRREARERPPGLVADGRDMGTVVFPAAQVKIFLTASAEERAKRRYKQLKGKGLNVNLADLAGEIRERDERDRNRSVAPLVPAASAVEVDSTSMSIDEVTDLVLGEVVKTFPDLS
ncbi:MAG: (d)CMP kinase [Pseudomonadota bacterium]